MVNNAPSFRTVMRGYDPTEVERRISELHDEHKNSRGQADQLKHELARAQEQIRQLTVLVDEAKRREAAKASVSDFTHLGRRIGEILSLAETEAAAMRQSAADEAKERLDALNASSAKIRRDADGYAERTRLAAERDAARVVEDARRAADQLADEVEQQCLVRRQEAEAVYEEQLARAAQSAADFEQTLAERREKAEAGFRERSALIEKQLQQASEEGAQQRAEAERATQEAVGRAKALVQDAEHRAETIVAEATSRADRIKSESDRQLAAAVQRRDSINAQLTNVRQMLATLSGAAPAEGENK